MLGFFPALASPLPVPSALNEPEKATLSVSLTAVHALWALRPSPPGAESEQEEPAEGPALGTSILRRKRALPLETSVWGHGFPHHFSQIQKARAAWGKCPKEVAEIEGVGGHLEAIKERHMGGGCCCVDRGQVRGQRLGILPTWIFLTLLCDLE